MNCPCCGQSISEDRLVVDLNTNTISYRGSHINENLPSKIIDLIFALSNAWPKPVSNTDLGYAMWGLSEPEHLMENLRVYVSRARRLLRDMDVSIETVSGRGYRLRLPGHPVATPARRLAA